MIVFAEALAGSPATYFMAGIVALWAALGPFGRRALEMGPMAIAGIVMYVVSTAIITSYHHVLAENQVAWWTASLLVVAVLYTVILLIRLHRAPGGAVMLLMCLGAGIALFAFVEAGDADIDGHAFRRSFSWFVQYAAIVALAFLCFVSVARNDLMGHLTWGVLFIAEGIGAAQVFDCQFLHGPQSVMEGSACAQIYNWSFAPHLPTLLPSLILAWILFRWFRPRPG